MISSIYNNINISAIASAVPTKCVKAEDYYDLFGKDVVDKNVQTTGVKEPHHVNAFQTSSDLATNICCILSGLSGSTDSVRSPVKTRNT